jgi:hypothetical protein
MSNQVQGNRKPVTDPVNDIAPEVISVARRWVVKAGLTAPVILTLRSKPLFGAANTTGCSAWMSASRLSASYALSGRRAKLGPMPAGCTPGKKP